MAKLYLITGFLGAGKTTFLHQFVHLFPGKRKALVINEFGKQGVDGTLLADLGISAHFYRMLPYLITLIVLAFTSKNSRAPKAEGIPYDKSTR